MNDQLNKLKGTFKIFIGMLIGSRELEIAGVADLTRARARRDTKRKIRLTPSSFRESVGQMTANERLAAEGKGDSRSIQAEVGRRIAILRP